MINRSIRIFFVFALLVMMTACGRSQQIINPEGYDLSSPDKLIMKEDLLEISGIAFLPGDNDSILAINDEQGKLFKVSLTTGKCKTRRFGGSGDFEDVAVFGNYIVVLQSNGKLHFFDKTLNEEITANTWNTDLPKGDYESLYADESTGKLYIICKSGKHARGNIVPGYTFSIQNDSTLSSAEPFTITFDYAGVSLVKAGLMVSAITKNKHTNEWFALSSANKLLIIMDQHWKVKSVHPLTNGFFLQPEGIAFDDQQNLYISNEGDQLSNGNILKFVKKGK